MAIILDHQLREQIPRNNIEFPITYFYNELATLPDRAGPLHWHPEFEIASCELCALDYRVGQEHIILEAGDSIFVNGNILHAIRQLRGDIPEPMPNIVFSGSIIASEISAINQKYIKPILTCDSLPYIVFRGKDPNHSEVNRAISEIYRELRERADGFELTVQRDLNLIFEFIHRNYQALPKSEASRIQIAAQIRIQKMLSYVYSHYKEEVTLKDIAAAANVSRSEAGRCFNAYMDCSPIEMLIRYRFGVAQRLLDESDLTLQEICAECGFNSVSSFRRLYKKRYGCSPRNRRALGK